MIKETLDAWLAAAGIESGPLFRCVCRGGQTLGEWNLRENGLARC
jgi:hypothetical protein